MRVEQVPGGLIYQLADFLFFAVPSAVHMETKPCATFSQAADYLRGIRNPSVWPSLQHKLERDKDLPPIFTDKTIGARCEEHGGYGFTSDCAVCADKQQAVDTVRQIVREAGIGAPDEEKEQAARAYGISAERNKADICCTLAGPGRGDCENFVGWHDDIDEYGRPRGWCFYCYVKHELDEARAKTTFVDVLHQANIIVRGRSYDNLSAEEREELTETILSLNALLPKDRQPPIRVMLPGKYSERKIQLARKQLLDIGNATREVYPDERHGCRRAAKMLAEVLEACGLEVNEPHRDQAIRGETVDLVHVDDAQMTETSPGDPSWKVAMSLRDWYNAKSVTDPARQALLAGAVRIEALDAVVRDLQDTVKAATERADAAQEKVNEFAMKNAHLMEERDVVMQQRDKAERNLADTQTTLIKLQEFVSKMHDVLAKHGIMGDDTTVLKMLDEELGGNHPKEFTPAEASVPVFGYPFHLTAQQVEDALYSYLFSQLEDIRCVYRDAQTYRKDTFLNVQNWKIENDKIVLVIEDGAEFSKNRTLYTSWEVCRRSQAGASSEAFQEGSDAVA